MKQKQRRVSLRIKLPVFLVLTVLIAAFGTAAIAFITSVNQINNYYKQCAADNARNFASLVDADFLLELRSAAESDEFQALRDEAEENEDEEPIREYLTEHGLWERYEQTRNAMITYVENIEDIKYLYLSAVGDASAESDMYLIDADDVPLYQTGYYEDREEELLGIDLYAHPEPTISNGDWGWLCSAFSPVYASDGTAVCVVGCDFGMEDVMAERREFLIYLILGALLFCVIMQVLAVLYISKMVARPLNSMTTEMEKFKPSEQIGYAQAGVMELPIKSRDEIGEIYSGIRRMQTNILDYLNDLSVLQKDKLRAEADIREKEKQIGQLFEENSRDTLTGVGSKYAYAKKVDDLNQRIAEGDAEFAIAMIDMNNLKRINDEFGHKAGDQYIKGCSRMICDAFKHSPVFRIGGDEFIVVVQGMDYESRHAIFQKLREDFRVSYIQEEKEAWQRYSAALGMAELSSDDTTVDLVFRRADKAMYADKTNFKKEFGSYR